MDDPEAPLVVSNDPITKAKTQEMPRMRIVAVVFIPWLVYIYLLTSFGYKMHHLSPTLTWTLGGLVIAACVSCWWTTYKKIRYRPQTARWTLIQALSLTFATAMGIVSGLHLYSNYMWQYYEFQMNNPYVNIDPSNVQGTSLMDSGQVYFKEGSFVEREEAIAYENINVYCVAPIVRKPVLGAEADEEEKAAAHEKYLKERSVDFWAIGINCCMPSGERFRCYDTTNPSARSGLRLLRKDQEHFFRQAVKQWSAQYDTIVANPLFYYWMNDPLAMINSDKLASDYKYISYFWSYLLANAIFVWFFHFMVKKVGM